MKTIFNSDKAIPMLLTVLLVLLILPSRSDAQTYTHIYVDAVKGTNAPTGRGSTANPYKSITYALLISARSNLADPWHVHIRPGTYDADPAKPAAEREVFPLNLRNGMIFEGTTTAEACVIDAQHLAQSTVPILSGQDLENVRIRNLTIENMSGRGITLNNVSRTTLEKCIIHNNARGGVWANKSVTLINNIFSDNGKVGLDIEGNSSGDISQNTFQSKTRHDGYGFRILGELTGNVTHNTFTNNSYGFFIDDGALTGDVTHNTFADNSLGGFRVRRGVTGNITHNTFTNNRAQDGGGFHVRFEVTGNITHNVFTNNKADLLGGGFYVSRLRGNGTHNIFDGNSAGDSGGGGGGFAMGATDEVEVSNNIFLNNTANRDDSNGGAVRILSEEAAVHFLNNLFVMKDVDSAGATVSVDSPNCRFHNNIFSGMQTAIHTEGDFDLPITHNIFHDIKQDIVNQGGAGVGNDIDFWALLSNNASDNLSANPQFIDTEIDRNFQLRPTSPAINAGTNAYAPTVDFAGNARPAGGTVDIGPYEFGGTVRPATPARFAFEVPVSVEAGEQFTADLTMDQAQSVAGISLTLHFDPAVIEVKDVQEGEFLLGGGTTAPFFQVEKIDNVTGVLSGVKLTRKVGNTTGGILLKVVFEAKAAGVSTIEVRSVTLGSATGQSIPVEATAGKVEVTPIPETPQVSVSVDPDVNGDGVVNILDLVMVSRHFGPAAAAPTGVDVDGSGTIDILDLVLVSQRL